MEQIRCSSSTEELVLAVKTDLYQQGKRAAAADLLAQSTEYSPSRPVKLRRILNKKEVGVSDTIHPRRCFGFYFKYGNVQRYVYDMLDSIRSQTAKCGHLPIIRENKRSKKTMLPRGYTSY